MSDVLFNGVSYEELPIADEPACECCECEEKPTVALEVKSVDVPCCGFVVNVAADSLLQGLMPRDLYVTPEGDDANDGFTVETAFASVQAAVDSTRRFVVTKAPVTIHVAPGTYDAGVTVDFATMVYPVITFAGDMGGKPYITGLLQVENIGTLSLDGFGVRAGRVLASKGSRLNIHNCSISSGAGQQSLFLVYATMGATIQMTGDNVLDCTNRVRGAIGTTIQSLVDLSSVNVKITGTVVHGTIYSSFVSYVHITTQTSFSGSSVSGPRYHVAGNGVIGSSGIIIPGSTAGTTGTGGVFA